jgi:hypothetical protein
MKRLALSLIVLAILVRVDGVAYPQTKTAQTGSPQAFTGNIMDSACAATGSHHAMMEREGAKSAKECTMNCVNHGSKFVLYDPVAKITYQLSDQSKASDYAGQKVNVTGTLDRTTNTIEVENIDVP